MGRSHQHKKQCSTPEQHERKHGKLSSTRKTHRPSQRTEALADGIRAKVVGYVLCQAGDVVVRFLQDGTRARLYLKLHADHYCYVGITDHPTHAIPADDIGRHFWKVRSTGISYKKHLSVPHRTACAAHAPCWQRARGMRR
jgi:hypothetical protein